MNKPAPLPGRRLGDLLHKTLKDSLARQGFAATELITRWSEIIGPELAEHCEPDKITWPKPYGNDDASPGILLVRVEGPTALEVQQLSGVILERVNRFFGWRAVAELRLRQAPLGRRRPPAPPPIDTAEADRIAGSLPEIADDGLRQALGRLGAAVRSGR